MTANKPPETPAPSPSAHNVEEPQAREIFQRHEQDRVANEGRYGLPQGECRCKVCQRVRLLGEQGAERTKEAKGQMEIAKNLASQLYRFMDASGFITRGLNGRELDALDLGLIIRIKKCLSSHAPKSESVSGFPQTDSERKEP